MAVNTTTSIRYATPEVWTPLNAGSAAAGDVSISNEGLYDALILFSTSSSAPTFNEATRAAANRLLAGEEMSQTTIAKLVPGLGAATYLYGAMADFAAATDIRVSCA